MTYFLLLILMLTTILYFVYKDFLKVLKITSIVTGISGLLTLIIGYLLKYILEGNINFINISKVTDIILNKFVINSIYLLLLSLVEIICYIFINHFVKKSIKANL